MDTDKQCFRYVWQFEEHMPVGYKGITVLGGEGDLKSQEHLKRDEEERAVKCRQEIGVLECYYLKEGV